MQMTVVQLPESIFPENDPLRQWSSNALLREDLGGPSNEKLTAIRTYIQETPAPEAGDVAETDIGPARFWGVYGPSHPCHC